MDGGIYASISHICADNMATILVLATAFAAIIYGFRRGWVRQWPHIIGMALGIVCTRIFRIPFQEILHGNLPGVQEGLDALYCESVVAAALIYFVVYIIFAAVTSFIPRAIGSGNKSVLDNIGGAGVVLFNWLFTLSILLNLWVAFSLTRPGSNPPEILQHLRSDDGNAVEEVILLGPACLGGEDAEELSHRLQLREAKKIS